MQFSLFPHFYLVFISCIVHEYLIWPSIWDSFYSIVMFRGGVGEISIFNTLVKWELIDYFYFRLSI
jgi:hypothetical protein